MPSGKGKGKGRGSGSGDGGGGKGWDPGHAAAKANSVFAKLGIGAVGKQRSTDAAAAASDGAATMTPATHIQQAAAAAEQANRVFTTLAQAAPLVGSSGRAVILLDQPRLIGGAGRNGAALPIGATVLKHDQPALLARTNSGESNGPDNALVPVVIRQILTAKHPHGADDGLLKIEGRPVTHAEVVGVVQSVVARTTVQDMVLADHTGSIDAILRVDATYPTPPPLKGQYIVAYGQPRVFDGKRRLNLQRVHPLEDCNYMTLHLLRVVHSHLLMTRPQPMNAAAARKRGAVGGLLGEAAAAGVTVIDGGSAGASQQQQQQRQQQRQQQQQGQAARGRDHRTAAGRHLDTSRYTRAQLAVLLQCRASQSAEGVETCELCSKLHPRFNEGQVSAALDWLSGEGLIYSTSSDHHWAAVST